MLIIYLGFSNQSAVVSHRAGVGSRGQEEKVPPRRERGPGRRQSCGPRRKRPRCLRLDKALLAWQRRDSGPGVLEGCGRASPRDGQPALGLGLGAGPRGCGCLVSRQASSPGGCRPPPVSSVVSWPSFLTRSQRQQHAAAGARLSVTLDALFSADAFAD